MKIIDAEAKTNWKYIAIVAVVSVMLAVGGILLLKTVQTPPPISHNGYDREFAKELKRKVSCPKDSFSASEIKEKNNSFPLIKPVFAKSIINPNYITGSLCFLEKPLLDQPVRLQYNFVSSVDAHNVTAKIQLPTGFSIVGGKLDWQGDIQAKRVQSIEVTIKADHWGTYFIQTRAESEDQTIESEWGGIALHIRPNDVLFRKDSIPNNEWYEKHSYEYRQWYDQQYFPAPLRTDDVHTEFAISDIPELNKEFTVFYRIVSNADLSRERDENIYLTFPPNAFEVVDVVAPQKGEFRKHAIQFQWKGQISKNEPLEIRAILKVINHGWGHVYGSVSSYMDNKWVTLDTKVLDIYVTPEMGVYIHRFPPQPQAFNTSTWQTYRNGEFGFEVRYPNGWFNVTSEETRILNSRMGKSQQFQFSNYEQPVFREYPKDRLEFSISIVKEEDSKFYDALRGMKRDDHIGVNGYTIRKISERRIDGSFGIRYTSTFAQEISRAQNFILHHFITQRDINGSNHSYNLRFSGTSPEFITQNERIFEQILSTFRFVELK